MDVGGVCMYLIHHTKKMRYNLDLFLCSYKGPVRRGTSRVPVFHARVQLWPPTSNEAEEAPPPSLHEAEKENHNP